MNIFILTIGDRIELRSGVKFVLNGVSYRKILNRWQEDGHYAEGRESPLDIVNINGLIGEQ